MSSLTKLLDQFSGKSPNQIAKIIGERKIRGRMGTTGSCPLALLLGGQGHGRVVIGRRYVVRQSGDAIERRRTPSNLATFVRKFDTGGYPELIAPPPRCANKARAKRPSDFKPRRKAAPRGNNRTGVTNHIAKLVGRFD